MRLLFPLLALPLAAAADGIFFDGPEVVKLDWNTTALRCADFNGDGLPDLALINQDRARIEFLLQRKDGPKPGEPERTSRDDRWNPVLELSRLDKQPLVIGRRAFALAVGDWNGDAKPDIAYTTDEKKLILRTQAGTGDWSAKKEFTLDSVSEDPESLLATDLNGDGRADLALLTETRLQLWHQSAPGTWAEAKAYALGQSKCGGLRHADLDGDGLTDLFYTSPEADAVFVRLQKKGGSYGQEWRLQIPSTRCWVHPVRLGKDTGLAWIRNDTGMVEVARLSRADAATATDRAASIRHAIPSTSDAKTGTTAYGDLDGDGHADVVLAEPKNARLWFFAGQPGGSFAEGREFPALSGIESLSISTIHGQPALVMLSPAEKSVGLSRWQKNRLTYPEVIHQSADTLLALTTGTLGTEKSPSIHALTESKGKVSLLTLSSSAQGTHHTPTTRELPSAPSKPAALRILDADQDGKGDLALFSTLAPMQILLTRQDEKAPFKRAEGLPDNLLNKLTPAALTTADLDGDGKDEFVIARDQLARAFRIGPDAKARTVEQFNAPDATAQISALVIAPPTAPGGTGPRALLADTAARKLYEMAPGPDGVFRAASTHALAGTTPEQCHLLPGPDAAALLLIGRTSFDLSPFAGPTLRLETVATFDSGLKDTAATDLLITAFTGAPADDILTLDNGKSRVIELFTTSGESPPAWTSALFFRVFETDPQYRGKVGLTNEPHDYLAPDLDGDGRPDLALLVHDRLLLYLRK